MRPNMTPRIEPIGYLASGGAAVDVSGPINWDPNADPAEIAVWFTAVVCQVVDPAAAVPIAMAIGTAAKVNTPGDRIPSGYQPTWWLTAAVLGPNAPKFVAGGATVSAWGTILGADGGSSSYYWALPIKLLPGSQKPPDWPW
jgi:hypothetical protein